MQTNSSNKNKKTSFFKGFFNEFQADSTQNINSAPIEATSPNVNLRTRNAVSPNIKTNDIFRARPSGGGTKSSFETSDFEKIDTESNIGSTPNITSTPNIQIKNENVNPIEKSKIKNVINQFLVGAETAERDFSALLGFQSPEKRRLTKLKSKNVVEKIASLSGEFLSPIPQLGGIPLIGQAISGAVKIAKPIGKIPGKLPVIAKLFKSFNKTGGVIKESFINTMSRLTNANEDSIKRLLERGNKAFNRNYLQKGRISQKNREKTSDAIKNSFQFIENEFTSKVNPFIKNKKNKLKIGPPIKKLIDSLNANNIIKKGKDNNLIAGDNITSLEEKKVDKYLRVLEKTIEDLKKKPTPERVHGFRQNIRKSFSGSELALSPESRKIFNEFQTDLSNLFPKAYQEKNKEFRKIFEIRDEFIRKKLDTSNVESTLLGLRGKGKSFLEEGLAELDKRLPPSQKFLDEVLDELSIKELSDFVPNKAGLLADTALIAALMTGRVGGGIGLLAPLTSPRIQSLLLRSGGDVNRFLKNAISKSNVGPIPQRLGLNVLTKNRPELDEKK